MLVCNLKSLLLWKRCCRKRGKKTLQLDQQLQKHRRLICQQLWTGCRHQQAGHSGSYSTLSVQTLHFKEVTSLDW